MLARTYAPRPVADKYWGALFERFSGYQFGMLDPQTNQAIAMGNSIPLSWNDDLINLPERGWDWAFEQAVADHEAGRIPNILCAIQIAIHPDYQGRGLSSRLVETMRSIGRDRGFHQLIAPVRPNQKGLYPLNDIDRYVTWKTREGLPFDAWLRVHVRLGGAIIKVCHRSMLISGNLEEWERWTKLEFPESGSYVVPGALNPVDMDLEKKEGVYLEPNVWVVHGLN